MNDAPHTPASKYCFGTTTADIVTTSVLGPTKGSALQIDHIDSTKYYYPKASDHRAFESMCMAKSDDGGSEVLCLFQSKINADVAGAIEGLNQAAEELGALKVPVLCVAHVVGASDKTTAQQGFRHAYILVREQEVEQFYTPTFARATHFLHARHSTS